MISNTLKINKINKKGVNNNKNDNDDDEQL